MTHIRGPVGADDCGWPAVAALPALGEHDIHLWYARLDWPDWEEGHLADLLSIEERARAARLRFARDQVRFTTGRGLLRRLLGAYLGAAPADLCFSYGAQGKPALADLWAASRIQFNLAHSGDHLLVALAYGRRLGVDIEVLRPMPDATSMAASFFAPSEAQALAALADAARSAAFLAGWTRKEALLKATGAGITRALADVVVSLEEDAPPQRCYLAGEPVPWLLESRRPTPGTIAALAVEGEEYRLSCLRLMPGE